MPKVPSPLEVREAIEQVQRTDIRMFLKTAYVGALRGYELTGKICPGDSSNRNIVYGPKGTDVSTTTWQPTEITTIQLAQIMGKQITLEQAMQPVKVALFKIKIAKQSLEEGEEPPFRYIALPFNSTFEPWTQELHDYFKQAGNDYVFPFTRQDVWYWITKKEPVFKGMAYPVHKYRYHKKTGVTITVLRHLKPLKAHGIRHVSVDDKKKFYRFDGFDFAAFIGWTISKVRKETDTPMPTSLETYAELRENWESYFPKLLKKRVW